MVLLVCEHLWSSWCVNSRVNLRGISRCFHCFPRLCLPRLLFCTVLVFHVFSFPRVLFARAFVCHGVRLCGFRLSVSIVLQVLKKGVEQDEAKAIIAKFKAAGAVVEIA